MKNYFLYEVIPCLITFVDDLSRWFLRFNKGRLKGDAGQAEWSHTLATLFEVLYSLCRLMAPFTPFLVEHMYQNLKQVLPKQEQQDSVHYLYIPEANASAMDKDIERQVKHLRLVIDSGRAARETAVIGFKTPVPKITIVSTDEDVLNDCQSMLSYVKEQINSREVVLSNAMSKYVEYKAELKNELGKVLKHDFRSLALAVQKFNSDAIRELQSQGKVMVQVDNKQMAVSLDDVVVAVVPLGSEHEVVTTTSRPDTLLILVKKLDESCVREGCARSFMSNFQKLRKKVKLTGEEEVVGYFQHNAANNTLKSMLASSMQFIQKGISLEISEFLPSSPIGQETIHDKEFDYKVTLYVCHKRK